MNHEFNKCTSGDWNTSPLGLDWQVIDKVVYFQCSKGKRDWAFNLLFPASIYKNSITPYMVHTGFKLMWHSVRDEILSLDLNGARGYSQGGVFAQMTHEDFLVSRGVTLDTVTFGSPPFLWMPEKKIQNRYCSVINIRNKEDIVPKVLSLFGYKRVGQDVILTGDNKKDSSMGWMEYLSGHSPKLYRRRLHDFSNG